MNFKTILQDIIFIFETINRSFNTDWFYFLPFGLMFLILLIFLTKVYGADDNLTPVSLNNIGKTSLNISNKQIKLLLAPVMNTIPLYLLLGCLLIFFGRDIYVLILKLIK